MLLLNVLIYISLMFPDTGNGLNTTASNAERIDHYKDVPLFIREYLDSKVKGEFIIADPGEPWSSGCIRDHQVPSQQME